MKISKIPYPLFAYRYWCDYAHEWDSLLCISALRLRRGVSDKLIEIVHAGNSEFYTDALIISQALDYIKSRTKKIIYAMENPTVLQELL